MLGWRATAVAAIASMMAMGGAPSAVGEVFDTTPPVLSGVVFLPDAVALGDPLDVRVDASDDVGLARVLVWLEGIDNADQQRLETYAATAPSTHLPATVDSRWGNGHYRVSRVYLVDTAGNDALYGMDGVLRTRPATATTHDVDLGSPVLAVSGASDKVPPTLGAISTISASSREGLPATVAWSVSDPAGVAGLSITWTNLETSESFTYSVGPNVPPTGTAEVTLPWSGHWALKDVVLEDAVGNRSGYARSGVLRWFWQSTNRAHDLNLSVLDATLLPNAPTVAVYERPARLSVVLDASPRASQLYTGYLVEALPSGQVRQVAVRATIRGDRMVIDLTGLPNGVTQTVKVQALSAAGPGLTTSKTARPRLSSNVQGVPDVTGDKRPDVVAQRPFPMNASTIMRYAGTGTGKLRAGALLVTQPYGCLDLGPFSSRANWSATVFCRADALDAYAWADRTWLTLGSRGWSSMHFVDGGYDLTGDRLGDVIAVDSTGRLRLYIQNASGTLRAGTTIKTGWQSMIAVVSPGDLTRDGRNDIAAVDSAGRLWVYPGNGKGGLGTRRQIGSGWQWMGALLPLRDFDGDGLPDLGGITTSGELRLYRGTSTGTLRPGVVIGTGWQRYL